MFPPIVTPYLLGVVTAPLVVRIAKPIVRGTVKASVGLAMEAKKAAAEAGQEYRGLAAEASADMATKSRMAAKTATKNG
ncbi:MAG: DUF5132 domain-containing protein [Actinomycetota bacterium]|nr:DUF5132 domain-containing protein [Actinomycetota bacterium]